MVPLDQMGPIDPPDIDKVKKEPYSLPASFMWSDVNLSDEEQVRIK